MARIQDLKQIILNVTTSPIQLSNIYLEATSVIIQNPQSNADFLKVGNSLGQEFFIAPGKDLQIRGDNLDHGTSAFLDLSKIYLRMNSGTGTINASYLDKW